MITCIDSPIGYTSSVMHVRVKYNANSAAPVNALCGLFFKSIRFPVPDRSKYERTSPANVSRRSEIDGVHRENSTCTYCRITRRQRIRINSNNNNNNNNCNNNNTNDTMNSGSVFRIFERTFCSTGNGRAASSIRRRIAGTLSPLDCGVRYGLVSFIIT